MRESTPDNMSIDSKNYDESNELKKKQASLMSLIGLHQVI